MQISNLVWQYVSWLTALTRVNSRTDLPKKRQKTIPHLHGYQSSLSKFSKARSTISKHSDGLQFGIHPNTKWSLHGLPSDMKHLSSQRDEQSSFKHNLIIEYIFHHPECKIFHFLKRVKGEGPYLNLERGSCWWVSLDNFAALVHQELLKVPFHQITQKSPCAWFQELINWSCTWPININLPHVKYLINKSLTTEQARKESRGGEWNQYTLSKMGNSALNLVHANCFISEFVPGSCPPNWLHGKAKISNPAIQNCTNTQCSTWKSAKKKKKETFSRRRLCNSGEAE